MLCPCQTSRSTPQLTTQHGFTLVELMITIAVLAISLSIAVPSFQAQLAGARIKQASSTLVQALNQAKAESQIQRAAMVMTVNTTSKTVTVKKSGATTNLYTHSLNQKNVLSGSTTVTFNAPNRTSAAVQFNVCDSTGSTDGLSVVVSAVGNIDVNGYASC